MPNDDSLLDIKLVALRTEPPLQHADEGFQAELAAERERLLGFYEAGLYAYNGQRERWASTLRRFLAEDGNNPYITAGLSKETNWCADRTKQVAPN